MLIVTFEIQGAEASKPSSTLEHDEHSLQSNDRIIVERQRRITPFNDWSSKTLFLTDPPHLMWNDGSTIPIDDVVGDHDWEPLIEVILRF